MDSRTENTSVLQSSQALFASIIDYAGLFPPAALPLPAAFENYHLYQSQKFAWILGQFILTPSHLETLSNQAELLNQASSSGKPFPISLVTKNPSEDLKRIAPALAKLSSKVRIKSIEVAIDPSAAISNRLPLIIKEVSGAGQEQHPNLFLEIPDCPEWDDLLVPVLEASTQMVTAGHSGIGFKLRCGGAPHLIPSPKRVARVLLECSAHGIPIKFTAGLHQPFGSNPNQVTSGTITHGYLTLFFAALMANRDSTTSPQFQERIEEILQQDGSDLPQFTDSGISWLGHTLTAIEIAQLRATRVTSFGSCSFVEPIDEAIKHAWL